MKRYLLISFALVLCIGINAQLSTNEQPFSFRLSSKKLNDMKSSLHRVTMPALDMAKIEAEDKEDEEYDMPPRFGFPHFVDYDLTNSGTWYELPDGDKLWQLNVVCPGALSVNFCYDKFWIPEGGKFFVYSKDRKHCIGAFTSRNNKGDSIHVRGFATGLVNGNDVILEYYQPKEVSSKAIISIDYVVHGYRYINFKDKSIGDAGSCMVNINCEEGQNWQYEKRAVARILIEGVYYCSGSLIATTDLSGKPFFLTADHCIENHGDAAGNNNLDYTLFYWNFEAPGCTNVNLLTLNSTVGATILANNSMSDFALLRLTEDPINLSCFSPFYLGWDCSGEAGTPGVCIHHPKGDVKKISTVKTQPISFNLYYDPQYDETFWKVYWKSTLNGHGVIEQGSSGSPLLTASHKVIGQAYGGTASDCDHLNGYTYYGKIDVSWNGYGNDSICRRLNCWLDSLNNGLQTMEGLLMISTSETMNADQQLYSNIRITSRGQFIIQSDVELMGNSRMIVDSGGKLIINGGSLSNVDLVLKPGASLQIINNGIIETRNGFNAPVGAIVNVAYGQII